MRYGIILPAFAVLLQCRGPLAVELGPAFAQNVGKTRFWTLGWTGARGRPRHRQAFMKGIVPCLERPAGSPEAVACLPKSMAWPLFPFEPISCCKVCVCVENWCETSWLPQTEEALANANRSMAALVPVPSVPRRRKAQRARRSQAASPGTPCPRCQKKLPQHGPECAIHEPLLVFSQNTLREVPWVNNKSLQSYSSFGALGGVCAAGGPCQKVTSYLAKWTHQAKASGAPPSWAPSLVCAKGQLSWTVFPTSMWQGADLELRVGPDTSLASGAASWP